MRGEGEGGRAEEEVQHIHQIPNAVSSVCCPNSTEWYISSVLSTLLFSQVLMKLKAIAQNICVCAMHPFCQPCI